MNITLQNISKAYGGHDIFYDFSQDIDPGVRLCVCGPNGTGKSTLLRMLAGDDMPDSGRIIMAKGCRVGHVEQDLDAAVLATPLLAWVVDVLPAWHEFWQEWEKAVLDDDKASLIRLAAKQAELESVYGYNPEHKARAVLSGLGFSENKWHLPISKLSGGWRERAKLARVLVAGADLLLLDEPTNHLDIEAVEWLEAFLLDYKGVLVFVAHDRVFMDKIGNHVLYLGGAKPLFKKSTFSEFVILQEKLEEQREREHQRLQTEIERKMDFVRRFGAKATKARQAGSRQKMVKKLEKELDGYRPTSARKELHFKWPEPVKSDKTIISAADVSFRFPDGGQVWPALTFNIFRGQRVALVGPNGSGKSTLLKIVAGKLERSGGSLVTGPAVRMGYFSQHQTEILRSQGTVLGEIRRLSDPRTSEEELMSVLGLFMLGQNYFDRLVSTLSGGERSRLVLASLFLARCNFLVLDEPTNHLDLESREALVEALESFEGALFMVAHDRYLLSEVAAEVWAVGADGLTVYQHGFSDYDAARRKALQTQNSQQNDTQHGEQKGEQKANQLSRDDAKNLKREQAEQRNIIYKELRPKQEKCRKLEQELALLLEEQGNLEAQLADPDVYADNQKATSLLKRFKEVQDTSETLFEKLAVLEQEVADLEAKRAAFSGGK